MFFWFSPTDVSYFVPFLFLSYSSHLLLAQFFSPALHSSWSSDCAWCVYWGVWCPPRPATLRPLLFVFIMKFNVIIGSLFKIALSFSIIWFVMSLFCSCVSSSFHEGLLLLLLLLSFFGFVFQMTVSLLVSGILSFLSLSISFCVHSCLPSLASQLEEHQRKRSKRENLSIHFLTSSVSLVVRMQVLPPLVLLLSTFHV